MSRTSLWIIAIAVLAAGVLLVARGRRAPASGPAQPLETFHPASGGEMVRVPAGQFVMGDATGKPDETPHAVSVSSFFIDKFPVTEEMYEKVTGTRSPASKKKPGSKDDPAEQIRWTDAARFCNACSQLEGLTPCYDPSTWACDFSADGYRLPTEAEWEFACRAGSTTRYCFGDNPAQLSQYAWSKENSLGSRHPVGQKTPNAWGLCDVHGNVWQWCNDWYAADYYKESTKENPHGPQSGKMRVLRGGAWDWDAQKCRSACRAQDFPNYVDACAGHDAYGFRRVRISTATVRERPTPAAVPSALRSSQPERKPLASQEPRAKSQELPVGKLDPKQLKGTIIFASNRGGKFAIWRMHASGGDAKSLSSGPENDVDPRFSPDGKKIAYTSQRGGFPEVWTMNRDGSSPQKTCAGGQPDWSPDGKSLVFMRENQIWTRELSSGNEKRVTPDDWQRCWSPAWSPDGKRIALASRHVDGAPAVFFVNVDGDGNTKLKTEDPACTPRWSKDGKKLLCQTDKGRVHQVNADGTGWEQVTFGGDAQHEARYSPDGSMLLFCRGGEGQWQVCARRFAADDEMEFAQLTTEGCNQSPDWSEE
ncbi:MAG TPA: SUMF1/EgtB/PvdO family nonheme iron enzyme [Planctomycetota bacterium]|jgi:formylglycine-generating enzyme required for sulfatase activity